MSERRKANVEGALYFVTLTVLDWVDVFTRTELVEDLLVNIRYCQRHKGLELFAYVIMPSHLHLVVRRDEGLLSEWLRDFKSVTAKRILHLIETHPAESRSEWLLAHFRKRGQEQPQNREFAFWKKDSHPVELFTRSVIDQKINYIHMNPVKAGMVSEPGHYRLSSAHPDGPLVLNGYELFGRAAR
ncbi:MAG: transposase [Flavobacteriales bacterium]